MQVNVSQLLQDPIGSRRHHEFAEETDEGEHVSCVADLMRTDAGILITASCVTEVRRTCGRCLSPFTSETHFSFAEEFFPPPDVNAEMPDGPSDEESFTIDERHVLNISDAVQQYTILEQPLQTLCRPDCQGLCPQCGANLNEAQCSCASPVAIPAWEELRTLWNEKETA